MTSADDPAQDVQARVLAFYRQLAFNRHATVAQHVADLERHDPLSAYDVLRPLLGRGTRVLEVGCGTGWLSNSIARRHGAAVTGIDMNPDVVAFAREAAKAMRLSSQFECADLFRYRPQQPAEVVVSMGVLHHTHDCAAAVRRVCGEFLAPGGHALIGLYHLHGRRPFLEHFQRLQRAGASEAELLRSYRELHTQIVDDTHAMSWFRDQVLHPHETQHTMAEMCGPIADAGCELVGTSVNGFQPLPKDLQEIFRAEQDFARISAERLRQGRYYPGFFLFLARRKRP